MALQPVLLALVLARQTRRASRKCLKRSSTGTILRTTMSALPGTGASPSTRLDVDMAPCACINQCGVRPTRVHVCDCAYGHAPVALRSSPMGYTLLSMLPVRTCGRLLELGCGPGNVTELAHSMMPPSSTIVAYDISERMVDKTAARFRGKDGPTVEARVGDVQLVEGCEPGSFDGVVSNLCIFMCEDTEATLARMLYVPLLSRLSRLCRVG